LTENLTVLFEEIQKLLAAPASGAGAPCLGELEHTLTAGYAEALALEAERWRLERRLGEIAGALGHNGADHTSELKTLAKRLSRTDGELSSLRALLASLRARHSALRVAQA
jgi:ABC-type branched-subunit amino acid transport system ATPase component